MKKKYFLFFLFTMLFFIISTSIKYYKDYGNNISYFEIKYNNNYLNNKDKLVLSYPNVDASINEISSYLNVSSADDLYKYLIDKMMKYDNNIKMYNKNDYKILEGKINKKYLPNSIVEKHNIKDDIGIQIKFEKNYMPKKIDVEKLYFEINKEEIIRNNIVKTAKSELGNGGEKYWKWYGFNHRVEWCCVFISWVAKENDILYDQIPKFIWVKKGVEYFENKDLLRKPKKYTPKKGDVIFFNWNNNSVIDHVGIVEKVSNGYVYTIEGNVQYKYVASKKYKINSPFIYAYGTYKF